VHAARSAFSDNFRRRSWALLLVLVLVCTYLVISINLHPNSRDGFLLDNHHHSFASAYAEITRPDGSRSSSNNDNNNNSHSSQEQQQHLTTSQSLGAIDLLIDLVASLYRMFSALGLSFLAAIMIGTIAALKQSAAKIIIPVIDVMQSVPILGFFPVAIAFFITLFNGSLVGVELAAIFLIFSSMVWNMIFSVYESVLSIPPELHETSRAFRASRLQSFRRLYLPVTVPKLVYNSMMSWSGGWYFLTAAEIISLGSRTYNLSGLGSLLGNAASSGNFPLAFTALGLLISVILTTDLLFWRPLEQYANRFKYESISSETTLSPPPPPPSSLSLAATASLPKSLQNDAMNRSKMIVMARLVGRRATFPIVQLSDFLLRYPRPLIVISKRSFTLTNKVSSLVSNVEQKLLLPVSQWFDNKRNSKIFVLAWPPILAATGILIFIVERGTISRSVSSLSEMYVSVYNNPTTAKVVSEIPIALLLSYLRLAAAYIITLAWTVPVAIKVARNPKFKRIMPVFQTLASIPATAFFPFMAILVNYIPGGLEFPSILLILTGMQWYMLFNLIGGVRSIPGDLEATSKAFRATRSQYIKRLLFPSIYPSFITGSITAWGGGWNALIVAEYIVLGDKKYSVLGIGSLLDTAAYDLGNTIVILMIVAVMVAVIVTINNLVWRRLYKRVMRKYSMSY
jgi:NitT/TauT family transport system permease protein